jgi:hypothetical protein
MAIDVHVLGTSRRAVLLMSASLSLQDHELSSDGNNFRQWLMALVKSSCSTPLCTALEMHVNVLAFGGWRSYAAALYTGIGRMRISAGILIFSDVFDEKLVERGC